MTLLDLQAAVAIRAHPMTDTNVDALNFSQGSIVVECDNYEIESLRDELADREQEVKNLEAAEKEFDRIADEQAKLIQKLEEKIREHGDLLAEVKDDDGTLLQYKERAEAAKGREILAWRRVEELNQETDAMRKRKGIAVGYFACQAQIFLLLCEIAQQPHGHQFKTEAEKILEQIRAR